MRFRNILPALAAVLSLASCSVYRQGQTPDDVYYSPVREQDSYVAANKNNDRYNDRNDYYNPDDNYLRMRVRDRYRWSSFDDYSYMNDWQYSGGYYSPYYYSPYGYAYNNPYMMYSPFGFNAYWNSYYSWNSFYNPYCPGIIVVSPKTNPVAYNNVRNFRLNSYTNNTYSNTNGNRGVMLNSSRYGSSNPRYNNSNYRTNSSNNSSVGGSLRRVFSNSNNNNNESYYNPSSSSSSSSPTRSYQPSSSSSSSTPSSSGSSGGGRSSGGGVSGSSGGRSGRGG